MGVEIAVMLMEGDGESPPPTKPIRTASKHMPGGRTRQKHTDANAGHGVEAEKTNLPGAKMPQRERSTTAAETREPSRFKVLFDYNGTDETYGNVKEGDILESQ